MIRFALLLALLCSPALAATPASFPAEFKAAEGGQTITLEPGDYGVLYVRRRTFDPPLIIKGGRFSEIRVDEVSGLTFDAPTVAADSLPYQHSKLIKVTRSNRIKVLNGVFAGPVTMGGAIDVGTSSDFEVRGNRISKLLRGITIGASSRGVVAENRISNMTGDGIDVANSHDVIVRRNSITDFSPLVYADGSKFHPDAIQMWSNPGATPQSNIQVLDNTINCDCQGITQFDHDQGGSDNVVVSGNIVVSGYPHGIALYEARNARVTDNVIRTLPGSRWQSRLNIRGGSVIAERNDVGAK